MACDKCETEQHNYCSFCGQRLKDVCPECGEMEKIGKTFCETKMKAALSELSMYQKTHGHGEFVYFLSAFSAMGIAYGGVFYSLINISSKKITVDVGICITIASLLLFIAIYKLGFDFLEKSREKSRKKFLELHPKYAEILKKGKECK